VLRIPALADLPWFLPGLAISVVIGYLVRHRAARFLGASPLLGWAVVVSLGIVASATLTPLGEGAFEGGAQASGCDFSRVGLASLKDILELGDTFLNILLFIPLGAALALLPRSRRKAWLMAGALALPIVIETTQLIATPSYWAFVKLTLSYAFILIAVAVLVIWAVVGMRPGRSSTVATAPPAATSSVSSVPEEPRVTAAQLPKLLLSIDDVKHAVNAPNLAKVEDTPALIGTGGLTVTPSDCLSALFASTKEAYQHSSARGTFSRAITGDGQDGMAVLNETMSTFDNMSAATSFVSQLSGDWRGCAGKAVTVAGKGNTITLDVGQPEANGTVMTLHNSLRGSLPGFSSDRAIVAKANVVIDLDAQGFDMSDSLKKLVDQTMARVPG
jgi:hypothetical protein